MVREGGPLAAELAPVGPNADHTGDGAGSTGRGSGAGGHSAGPNGDGAEPRSDGDGPSGGGAGPNDDIAGLSADSKGPNGDGVNGGGATAAVQDRATLAAVSLPLGAEATATPAVPGDIGLMLLMREMHCSHNKKHQIQLLLCHALTKLNRIHLNIAIFAEAGRPWCGMGPRLLQRMRP